MNLKQFSDLGGCKVVVCGAGWGGKYGYTTLDAPNSTTCGFKTKALARECWLRDTFGEIAGNAVLQLLDRDIRGKSKDLGFIGNLKNRGRQMNIRAVLTYTKIGNRTPCGNTVGEDGSGTFSVVFVGSCETAEKRARQFIRDLETIHTICDVHLVTSEDSYCGSHITII